jgi:dTDP-4-dehydrorhamnose reductase
MWGGVECSHVRIGERVRDQLSETGHLHRIEDLDLIAGLGIRTLRYPILWEKVETAAGCYDWSWADARLARLSELEIKPIVGFLHHGNGPPWSNLLASSFQDDFSRFAAAFAERYPWVEHYTPINEPLTTARMSGLYGLWQPHGHDEKTCFQLVVAQCLAIAQAMEAIRRHVPEARLVQTEDVGRVFSSPRLAYQAEYENERRWLSLDLLAGRVDDRHPMHHRLLGADIDPQVLVTFTAHPCAPDFIGLDYYLTSDRMLDEGIDRHPGEPVGGNGIDAYVDSAAVRFEACCGVGLDRRIDEVWERYHLPIAVTELHNGSTRDEQVRWLVDGWNAAAAAAKRGVAIQAVTAWSLFGAVDWNTLLTARSGFYENGAFDVRGGIPRATALAQAITALASNGRVDHPVLDRPGWWAREQTSTDKTRPLLLVGFGRLISALEECCAFRRLPAFAASPERSRLSSRNDGAWALIAVAPAALRIVCQYPDNSELQLQYDSRSSLIDVANAALDLIIDGQRGRFALRCAAANQFALSPLVLQGELVGDAAQSFVA